MENESKKYCTYFLKGELAIVLCVLCRQVLSFEKLRLPAVLMLSKIEEES